MGFTKKQPYLDRRCPKCNREVLYGRHCEKCGSKLGALAQHYEVYCEDCGTRLAESEKVLRGRDSPYCANCGARVI